MKMLATVYDVEFSEAATAALAINQTPLLDCFLSAFLAKVAHLVKRGLRSSYVPQENNLLFLKGRLVMAANLRHNLVQRHRFHVSYDEFLPDRPENRLIHAALLKAEKLSATLSNRRLCRELRLAFADIPVTVKERYQIDFAQWRLDRSAAHYAGLNGWCQLLLADETPMPAHDSFSVSSFLFNTHQLFERYVAIKLNESLAPDISLIPQYTFQGETLTGNGEAMRADLVFKRGEDFLAILDTKWKLFDESSAISPADKYQMYAYGRFATAPCVSQPKAEVDVPPIFDLALITPLTENYPTKKGPFVYADKLWPTLRLSLIAYDLVNDKFECPSGLDKSELGQVIETFNKRKSAGVMPCD